MAGNNALNNNDSMDINELAALDTDISPEVIEELHKKLSAETQQFDNKTEFNENDDTTLFEDTNPEQISSSSQQSSEEQQASENNSEDHKQPQMNDGYDDNFIKKYRAKLNKQQVTEEPEVNTEIEQTNNIEASVEQDNADIQTLTNGNITEKAITPAQKEYNDSLDLLDGNVKYSKYVIYIDPQNVDFIESLTIKERKNLINNILQNQNDISLTRKKFKTVQTIIKHTILAILTLTLSVPVIYWAINTSLEASINNYRRSQTNFQTLYREKGKINIKQPR